MNKQEILNLVNQLPDDVEIDLVVADDNDNTEVERIVVNTLENYPAELVFVLAEGYHVAYEREGEVDPTQKTDDELRDIAYHLSTGNHMTESFGFDDFQKIDSMDYVWQPFEDWCPSEFDSQIAGIADVIFTALKTERDRGLKC